MRLVAAKTRDISLLRVEPAWATAIVCAVSIMLVVGVSRLLVDLAEVWTPGIDGAVEIAMPVGPTTASGVVTLDGRRARLHLEGEHGAEVLILIEGRSPQLVTLDRRGHATIDLGDLPAEAGALRLRGVGSTETTVSIPARPTVTATRTATPTTTATSSPTPTRTATSTRPPAPPTITATTAPPTVAATPAVPTNPTAQPPRPTRPPIAADRRSDLGTPPVLHLVSDAGPGIALTFDGATSADRTVDLLDLLHRLDVKVTMFVTGKYVERYPAIVRRALLAGHEVGNHTFSHPRLTSYSQNRRHDLLPSVTREWFESELRLTETAFRAATGRPMAPLWRAPYGEENSTLRGWAMELGYLHIRWSSLQGVSLDSLDWVEDEHSSLYFDSSRLVDRLLAFPELEGGIVLMHLSTKRRVPPWSDLPRFVQEIRKRGLEVDTVSTLLERSDRWRPWLERARTRHAEIFPE